ncbi:MAG: tetratricopeptide repeat protein [Methylacidiphilales bacterium]|nr:tetratricopeptide repeat protein [Candidatus Methylacidiphilales bacterium]
MSRFNLTHLCLSACVFTWATCPTIGFAETTNPPIARINTVFNVLQAEFYGYRGDYQKSLELYLTVLDRVTNQDVFDRIASIAIVNQNQPALMRVLTAWKKVLETEANQNNNEKYLIYQLHYFVLSQDWEGLRLNVLEYYRTSLVADKEKIKTINKLLVGRIPQSIVENLFQQLVDTNNTNLTVVLAKIDILLFYKKIFEAVDLAKKLYLEHPSSLEVIMSYAQTLQADNQTQVMLDLLVSAHAKQPQDATLGYLTAISLLKANRPIDAIPILKQIVDNDPANEEALRLLCLTYISDEALQDKSYQYFNKLVDFPDSNSLAQYYLGLLALNNKKYDIAEEHFRAIDKRDEQYRDARISLSRIYQETNRLDDALVEIQALVTDAYQTKDEIVMIVLLASFYQQQSRYEKAEEVIVQALQRFPNEKELRYQHALILLDLDKPSRAIEILKKVLDENPKDANSLNAYGYTLAERTSQYETAYGYIKQGLDLEPENPAILDSMGFVLFKLGKLKEAKEYLERAYQLSPDPEIGSHLIEVYKELGLTSQMKMLILKLVSEHPKNKHIKKYLP